VGWLIFTGLASYFRFSINCPESDWQAVEKRFFGIFACSTFLAGKGVGIGFSGGAYDTGKSSQKYAHHSHSRQSGS
jgi:hypothetical protein